MPAKVKSSPASPASESAHQPFQQAHEAYVRALDDAWNQIQRQGVDHHLEFQQRALTLSRATTADEFKQAQDSMQQMMAGPTPDPALSETVGKAFTQYKTAIKAALNDSDLEDLNPAMLSAIGQSLSTVACLAHQASLLAPAAKSA
jgi:hypothetical protein